MMATTSIRLLPHIRQDNSMYEIAVHLRRGDVSPCTHARRYLPNSHYLALIDQYTTIHR